MTDYRLERKWWITSAPSNSLWSNTRPRRTARRIISSSAVSAPLRGTGSKIWCGWFDGDEKSERVQEKCGFIWHHTRKDVYCELMGDIRTEQISCLTRGDWLSQSKA